MSDPLPFFPHGQIPVPLSPEVTSESVEGLWQALKVFEGADVVLLDYTTNGDVEGLTPRCPMPR